VLRDWKRGTITIRQKGYIQRVLRACGAENYKPVKTPLKAGIRLSKKDSPDVVDPKLQRRYRMILGYLGFLVQMTRPDLAFAYAELSKFLACPGEVHLEQAERCLAYLVGTVDRGITYSAPRKSKLNTLEAWVDSDYAADPDTRRSVTGYVVVLNNGPVAWKAKRQACVTLSSAEAEFVAASVCCVEVLYLRSILRGFGYVQREPTTVWEDNASAIAMSNNPINPDKSRHIDTRFHFLRDMVKAKLIKLRKVPGTENVADALTKALDGVTLEKHVDLVMGRSRELLMERQVPEDKPGLAIIPKHVEMNAGLRQPMRCFLKTMGWGHDADFDPTPFAQQLMVAAAA
jgi:hypothetical protein